MPDIPELDLDLRAVHRIEGGYHVKDLPDGKCVDVMRMLFNWRVVRCDVRHISYDRGWCYAGTGLETAILAMGAALEWDGGDDTEPTGWLKRVVPFGERAAGIDPLRLDGRR